MAQPQDEPQEQQVPPSPSPPPAPPTALTPGARASAFITLYTSALDSTLKSVSYSSFSSCFPNIAQQAPEALKQMHGNLTAGLRKFGMDEFELILKEREVVARLNELEKVIADARRRKESGKAKEEDAEKPPHTLPPRELLTATLSATQVSQQSQLNARLQTVQSQNAQLIEGIRVQRQEIERLLGIGEQLVRDLEGAGGEMANSKEMGRMGAKIAGEGRGAESLLVEMEGVQRG